MKAFLILILGLLLMSQSLFAQEQDAEKKLTRRERAQIKRSIKQLQKKITQDPVLARRYLELINNCADDDEECQRQLQSLIDDTVQGSALDNSNGMTFGICKPHAENKKMHGLIHANRAYDCKLSSHGNVYDKKVVRKIYGPGLFWEKQALVMFCTGPAYGKKMTGMSVALGAYLGITATSAFGKIGACVSIGAGKSFGAMVGIDQFSFEE